ncbi:MAG: tripartite tricarboxylate transporter substrate binding protein [Betaproteobacteria bacterium]|nr:tripartite tricarboxylate transporter substrate binding protein [Betaproteobacteria bacterium]
MRFLVALLVAIASPALAQDYPAKPIHLIVPFPPGGGTDLFSRTIAGKLTEKLGWTIVVDNKPGAGGNLGVDAAAKSPADGYTMVMGQTSDLAVNPTLYRKLPYDPVKDLAPVVLVASAPIILVVAENSRYRSLADVVAAAKAKPGRLTLATPGNGTVAHLTGVMLQRAAGMDLVHVPYKGASQALPDLMGGQVDLYSSSVSSVIGQMKGGKVRAVVVASAKRSPALPDVPTVAESGYPGFDADSWYGLLMPAGAPPAIVQRMNAEVNKLLSLPDVRERIGAEGGEALGGTPQRFTALLKADLAKWGDAVRQSGAKVD